jgi:DNA polymerase-3 subunit epsilon
MTREICLDTETTGLDPKTGHRLIEIACIEIEDFIPTGRSFHRYINPDRDIDPDAERVHGISRASLLDKPRFEDRAVSAEFLEFIGDATLIAHNAAFDRGFINAELERAGLGVLPPNRWTCTYELAKSRFPGAYNSLDALCKRFRISLAEREKHGALIDTRLLSMVYLELRGGKERALDLDSFKPDPRKTASAEIEISQRSYGARPAPLAPRVTDEELAAHSAFVEKYLKDAAVWRRPAG